MLENEQNEKLQQEKSQSNLTIDQYKQKLQWNDDQLKDLQRRVLQSESEYEKQKALLEQKQSFLENSITEYQKREKQL